MTPRENLIAVLSGEEPEWMPACVHVSNVNNLPGFLPAALLMEPIDFLAVGEHMDGDLIHETSAVRERFPDGFGISSEYNGEGDLCHSSLITPEGVLTQQIMISRVASPTYGNLPAGHTLPEPFVFSTHAKYFVTGQDDYRILSSYHHALTYEADHDLAAEAKARIGDRGILLVDGAPSPLYALVSSYAGIERLIYDLADAPNVVEDAMQEITRASVRWYEAAAATPCDGLRCTEDLDTKLISPELFRRYAVPALREYARVCHNHGKLFVIHMCGHIRGFLEDIRSIGADAIHCLAPPPMGDTTVSEAFRILGGRVAAMIRCDANLLLEGSHDQIEAAVAAIVEEMGDWRNCLMIIPCGRAAPDRIRFLIECIHARGDWREPKRTTSQSTIQEYMHQ